VWLGRAAREPKETQLFTLRTIRFMDDRIANPLYGLLALSGLFMVFNAGFSLSTPWLAAAITLYVIALVIAAILITPNLRTALNALESGDPSRRRTRRRWPRAGRWVSRSRSWCSRSSS